MPQEIANINKRKSGIQANRPGEKIENQGRLQILTKKKQQSLREIRDRVAPVLMTCSDHSKPELWSNNWEE